MSKDHFFRMKGMRWLWRYTRLKGGADGWAYVPRFGAENSSVRKVLIDSRLKNQKRLSVEIHEALHCLFPELSEESVNDAGADIARILWNLGYRINEDKSCRKKRKAS